MDVTVSSKYQVVIPKALRRQLNIKAGQRLTARLGPGGSVVFKKDPGRDMEDLINKYAGSLQSKRTAWGRAGMDPAEWLRRQRDQEWD